MVTPDDLLNYNKYIYRIIDKTGPWVHLYGPTDTVTQYSFAIKITRYLHRSLMSSLN